MTGLTVSQSPAQLGDALFNDGSGNQWSLTSLAHKVEMLGAVGDGVTDDKPAWDSYLNAYAGDGCSGTYGRVYGLSSQLDLPPICKIRTSYFLMTSPSALTRVLNSPSNVYFEAIDVTIDRGTDKTAGTLGSSSAVWIVGGEVRGVRLKATGNGYGSGLAFFDFTDLILDSPEVFDVFAGDATAPEITDDVFQGLWLNRGEVAQVNNLVIRDFTIESINLPATNQYNRGVAVGGTKDFTFNGGVASRVGQGWDFTGDQNSSRFVVIGAQAIDVYSWGFKAANTVTDGSYIGCRTLRAGLGGFVANAPAEIVSNPQSEYTQNIDYLNCTAKDTGFSGNWTGTLASFVCLRNDTTYPLYPQGIKFINCKSDGGGYVKHGFLNEILTNTDGDTWNEVISCKSTGATIADFQGWQEGNLNKRTSAAQTIPNNTLTDVIFGTTGYDGFNGVTSDIVTTIQRSGVYSVNSVVEFIGNASGVRKVRLIVNNSNQWQVGSTSNASSTAVSLSTVLQLEKGDLIKIGAFQDSGGNLDITQGETKLNISLVSF